MPVIDSAAVWAFERDFEIKSSGWLRGEEGVRVVNLGGGEYDDEGRTVEI